MDYGLRHQRPQPRKNGPPMRRFQANFHLKKAIGSAQNLKDLFLSTKRIKEDFIRMGKITAQLSRRQSRRHD
jgi:hypothetical protein